MAVRLSDIWRCTRHQAEFGARRVTAGPISEGEKFCQLKACLERVLLLTMRTVNRNALVPYSTQQMFELVDDVDSYVEFLPWCNRSEVLSRTYNVVEAMVELQKGNITKSFTTRNTLTRHESIELALLGGPFRSLDGGWTFVQLGEEGCKVSLVLDFEFENRLVDMMFGAFFEETCNSLVDAFTDRAVQVYG